MLNVLSLWTEFFIKNTTKNSLFFSINALRAVSGLPYYSIVMESPGKCLLFSLKFWLPLHQGRANFNLLYYFNFFFQEVFSKFADILGSKKILLVQSKGPPFENNQI